MSDRRNFLKNTALSTLGLGMASSQLSTEHKIQADSEESFACGITTPDYYGEGPFYTASPPMIEGNKLAATEVLGDRMIISGRVFNLNCSEFIPGTIIDVWHADDDGVYDNNGYNLRGYTTTNEQGFYLFETIKPGKYQNGSSFRPSHIHYKIKPPGFSILTTQLYFDGDTSIEGDAAASITTGEFDATNRIIPLVLNSAMVLEGTFDIVIDAQGISVGTSDLHLDKGMVYSAAPNPFSTQIKIHYGVFKRAMVALHVFDVQGRQVAILEEEMKTPDKYYATWQPEATLPSGHYFITLRINDLQVHYLKIFKQ